MSVTALHFEPQSCSKSKLKYLNKHIRRWVEYPLLVSSTWNITLVPDQSEHQEEPLEAKNQAAEPEPHRVAAVVVIDDLVTEALAVVLH